MDWRKAKDKTTGEKLIFHRWVEKGEVKLHPENPQHDRPYIATYALVENAIGEVYYESPSNIIFTRQNADGVTVN